MSNITDIRPDLANQPVFKEEVPIGAKPIDDVSTFAMHVDRWHATAFEHANRLLEIPEGTTIQLIDKDKPAEITEMDLNDAYLEVFKIGVMAAMSLFKDLPFGASIEEGTDDAAE